MKRLVLAVAAASLLLALLPASSASAAGEPVSVLLSQVDGTPAWDSDDNPGNDSGPANGVVRTNDDIEYTIEIRVEDGIASNTAFTFRYPQGVEAEGIPPYCGPRSTLTPETLLPPAVPVTATSWTTLPTQTLICDVGTRNPGSTLVYPIAGKVRPEVPQGTALGPVSAEVTTDDVTNPAVSNEQTATVSARPKFDISKNAVAQTENRGYIGGSNLAACPSDPDKLCFRYLASILISTPNLGKGVAPLASPIILTDDLTPASLYGQPNGFPVSSDPDWIAAGAGALQKYGAELVRCPATSVYTAPGIEVNGTSLTTTNSVRDSGAITCTQPGGPGTPVTISIANADTTAYTVPTTSYYPDGSALPVGIGYVVAGRIDFAIPYDAVLDLGVLEPSGASLLWDNKFNDFAPTGVDGTPNDASADPAFNDHRQVTSQIRARGSWGKDYIGEPNNPGNTPPVQFRPGWAAWEGPTNAARSGSGDGILLPGQVVMSGIQMHNTSTSNSDVSFVICDNWDNAKLRLKPDFYPGSTSARMQLISSNGDAVWFSGYKDSGPYRTTKASVPVTLNVEYGTGSFGTPETCENSDSPTGWQTDPNLVPGGLAAITKVRIHAIIPPNLQTVGTYTTVSIALEVLGADPTTGAVYPAGTILPNFASGKLVFGTHDLDGVLNDSTAWNVGTYDPASNSGSHGDRVFLGAAIARLTKEVQNSSGKWVTAVPTFTTNTDVDYRLSPTLTSGLPSAAQIPVTVEDCLAPGQSYVLGSASVMPTVQLGSPVGAGLSCPAGQIYLRWELGPQTVGAAIPPIVYTAHVSSTALTGTQTNEALISAEGDPSPESDRTAGAQIRIVAPSGVAIDKSALTPQSDINRAGEGNLDQLLWSLAFRNLDFPGTLSDVDIIDRLPANGLAGTSFSGTLEFDSATVTAGTNISILYTKAAPGSIELAANDVTNLGAGSTVWCDQPSGGAVVSGAGVAGDCPAVPAEVTGLRMLRPGLLGPSDVIDVEITMTPEGNREGDIYINHTAGRVEGPLLPVGPVPSPEVVVSAELGDVVWHDLNGDGVQTPGEPGIDGVTVSLYGVDDDGNPVGSAASPLTTITSGGGFYLFEELPAGTYAVTFDDSSLAASQFRTPKDVGIDDAVDSDGDPVTGTVSRVVITTNQNRLDVDQGVVSPEVTIVKYVNGEDANTAPGSTIAEGEPTVFTYVITNAGDLTLVGIELVDDVLGVVPCPTATLEIGESMTCTVNDVAASGAYVNNGDVSAQPTYPDGSDAGDPIEGSDPANYFGGSPAIELVKYVNGKDAKASPGAVIGVGDPALFSYQITNTGNLALADVALTDDVLGLVNCPATTLAAGASMICTAKDVAIADQYTNIGEVTAQPLGADGEPFGGPLVDTDPATYFGIDPSLELVKSVNGQEFEAGASLAVDVGDDLVFTYDVTNTGNVDITGIELDDDILGAVTCPATALAVGESMTCEFETTATTGKVTNVATVTGTADPAECSDNGADNLDAGVRAELVADLIEPCAEPVTVTATDDATYDAAELAPDKVADDAGNTKLDPNSVNELAFTGSKPRLVLLAGALLILVGGVASVVGGWRRRLS